MTVHADGGLICPYCGSKLQFKDKDLREYKEFRNKLLTYLRAVADTSAEAHAKADEIWGMSETVHYETDTGSAVTLKFLYSADYGDAVMYVARTSVVYVFDKNHVSKASDMLERIGLLRYPEADVKNLAKNFPALKGSYSLKNGGRLLIFYKPEEVYPLAMFGNLSARDAAWIVSRMENFCAVLKFSELCSGGIGIDSVLIDPRTHEAMLMGPWWNAHRMSLREGSREDLLGVRRVAKLILGSEIGSAPKAFVEFIGSKPKADAFADFEYWDEVIDKGFGGRSFAKFDIDKNLK